MAEIIGVVGNILQFLELAIKLFLKAREIYKSTNGLVLDHAKIIEQTERLQRLAKSIRDEQSNSKRRHVSPMDSQLDDITSDCESTCSTLLSTIKDLSIEPGANRGWGSLVKALQGHLRKSDIQNLQMRLEKLRGELTFYKSSLITNAMHNLKTKTTTQLDTLLRCARVLEKDTVSTQIDNVISRLNLFPFEGRPLHLLSNLFFPKLRRWHVDLQDSPEVSLRCMTSRWLGRKGAPVWIKGKSSKMKTIVGAHAGQSTITRGASRQLATAKQFLMMGGGLVNHSLTNFLKNLLPRVLKECPELGKVVSAVSSPQWTILDADASPEHWEDADLLMVCWVKKSANASTTTLAAKSMENLTTQRNESMQVIVLTPRGEVSQ